MRHRIQISRVCTTLFIVLSSGVTLLLPSKSAAQACTSTLSTTTQTQTISSAGNVPTLLTFTKYSPPPGFILVSAEVISQVKLISNVSMTNNTAADIPNAKLNITDEDTYQIGSTSTAGDNIITKTGAYNGPVLAGQTVSYGPTTTFNNSTIFDDIYTTSGPDLANFQGTGSLGMLYTASPGYGITGGSLTITSSYTVTNNISLIYTYCYTGNLAADILNFTAVKNGGDVDISWITANETAGRNYIVEVSPGNGVAFTDLTTIPATGASSEATYQYTYKIQPTDKGQLYFRLKMVDYDGTVAYSPMRLINLGSNDGTPSFAIFPNPATDHITLTLPGNSQGWQVDIIAADGSLVQRNLFALTNAPRIDFNHKMATGAYFVRATNTTTGSKYTSSFIIP